MKLSVGLKITALVIMGLLTAFLLLMGLGEMFGGDISGAGHLIPAALLIVMMWVGWKKPYGSGIFLLVVGIFNAVFYSKGMGSPEYLIALTIMALPFLISGGLLLAAALLEQKKPPQNHPL